MAAGDNYTFPMPTEELKRKLESAQEQLRAAEAQLAQARAERCPDPACPTCERWKVWEALNGQVHWLQCPTCAAGLDEPCRHRGRGVGRGYAPVLRRPHRGRPSVERPEEDLL